MAGRDPGLWGILGVNDLQKTIDHWEKSVAKFSKSLDEGAKLFSTMFGKMFPNAPGAYTGGFQTGMGRSTPPVSASFSTHQPNVVGSGILGQMAPPKTQATGHVPNGGARNYQATPTPTAAHAGAVATATAAPKSTGINIGGTAANA